MLYHRTLFIIHLSSFIIFFAAAFSGCQMFWEEIGHEGEPCSTKNTCRGDLKCVNGVCVNPNGSNGDADRADPPDSDPDAVDNVDYAKDGVDQTDGTDSTSGLTWQNPPPADSMTWRTAMDYCTNLTQDGHSDWRLPTISELRSLIRGCAATQTGGTCGVMDSCLDSWCFSSACNGCEGSKGPDAGCYWPSEIEGGCGRFWSASSLAYDIYSALSVDFGDGGVGGIGKEAYYYARCVRRGP